jgi:Globin
MKVYYHALEAAAESWKIVKTLPEYQSLVGELLFREIFEQAPAAISLYQFGERIDCAKSGGVPEAVYSMPAFKVHAERVVDTLETAIKMMLGDDMNHLALTLQRLGARHLEYGVLPQHYRVVETALLRTLEMGLKEHWNETLRKGWQAVFKFLAKAMMCGCEHEVEIVKEEIFIKERRIKLQTSPRSEEKMELERRAAFSEGVFDSPRWSAKVVVSPLVDRGRVVVTPENSRILVKRWSSFDTSPRLPVRSSRIEEEDTFMSDAEEDEEGNEPHLVRRNSDSILQRPRRQHSPEPPKKPEAHGDYSFSHPENLQHGVPPIPCLMGHGVHHSQR